MLAVQTVSQQSVTGYMEALASRQPTPGGGAAGAIHAAQAAALLAMVARYSDRVEEANAVRLVEDTVREADDLLARALDLAQADIDAFGALGATYRLGKDDDNQREARSKAIAAALVGAARPPEQVIHVAERVIALAEALEPVANHNVISDVAAAADAARAAVSTARVNVEINLGSIRDPMVRDRLKGTLAGVDALLARADAVSATVRRELG